jgi:hypothetical protein
MAFLVVVHTSQIRCTLILHMARLPIFVIYYSGRLLSNVLCRPLCSHKTRPGGWGHPWRLWHAWSYTLTRFVPSRVLVWGRRGRSSMSGLVSSSRHFEELALSHYCRCALTAHGRCVDTDTACGAAYHHPRPPHRVASLSWPHASLAPCSPDVHREHCILGRSPVSVTSPLICACCCLLAKDLVFLEAPTPTS